MRKQSLVGVVLLVGSIIFVSSFYGFLKSPSERYVGVVNEVQEKAVMFTVPVVVNEVTMVFSSTGATVHTSTALRHFSGSGVIISRRGFVLSCEHVFDGEVAGPIVATLSDGTTTTAKVIYTDVDKDLALLRIEGTYRGARVFRGKLELGQEVIVVGNPFSQKFSTTHGIISHIGRELKLPYTYTQTDAPINGGNSGGPLFNLSGEVIGIVARKWATADGMGLAISPETIREFLDTFTGIEAL